MVLHLQISDENLRTIEGLIQECIRNFERARPEARGDCMQGGTLERIDEPGTQYLLFRDILWLSYGIDIRRFGKNEDLKVDDKTASKHFLGVLKNFLTIREAGSWMGKVLENVYYQAEAGNGSHDALGTFVLDSIKDNDAYSLQKARELVGKNDKDGVVITNEDVLKVISNDLHENYLRLRKDGKGLLTFRALLGIKRELDIFADFYVPAEYANRYKEEMMDSGVEDLVAKRSSIYERMYQDLEKCYLVDSKGKKIQVKNLTRGAFLEKMANVERGDKMLDAYFPEDCREVRELTDVINRERKKNQEIYKEPIKIIDGSAENVDGEYCFSSEKAKAQTHDLNVLFKIFDGVQRCYSQ